MNILCRQFFNRSAGVVLLGLTLTAFGQPVPAPAEKSAAPAPETPAPPSNAAPATPEAIPAPAAEKSPNEEGPLRRIDQIDPPSADERERPSRRPYRNGGSEFPFGDHTVPPGSRMRDVVSILGSTSVDGEVDSDAVSVLGSTFIGRNARIGGAAVAVLGRLESEGDIRDKAVSVLGSSRIDGHVGGEAVAVLGNLHLGPNAVVDGDIVVVGGRLIKDPNAIVHGNEVRVPMLGSVGEVDWLTTWLKRCVFYGRPLAFGPNLGWAWAVALCFFAFYVLLALLFPQGVLRCAQTLEARPGYSVLASALSVMLTPVALLLLAATVVGALLVPFLGAGMLFAKLFGKVVMLAWIGRRFTRLAGDSALGHPVFGVLIGGIVVLALYTVPIVGFLTFLLLTWLGVGVVVYTIALSINRDRPPSIGMGATLPPEGFPPPFVPVVPVASAVSSESGAPAVPATSAAAMGLAAEPMASSPASSPKVSPGFSGSKSDVFEMPAVPTAGPAPAYPGFSDVSSSEPPLASQTVPPPVASAIPSAPTSALPPGTSAVPPNRRPTNEPPFSPRPVLAPVVAWERAGFFIRLGALALDGVLIGLIMAFISGILPRALRFHDGPGGWLIALALYGALMWKHKGTTIGGIVCGLKVVRVDHRELDWATAIVRALACFLSLAVGGLGFIWVAIDDDKQSWHDKIAGTTVVLVPKGVSLL